MLRKRLPAARSLMAAFLLAAACLVVLAPGAFAQTAGSSLVGRVADKDGGPLPGVTITAKDAGTGLTRSTVSGGDGTFRLPALPVGTYDVNAELSGFAPVTIQAVRLNVATERSLEITMGQASLQEEI